LVEVTGLTGLSEVTTVVVVDVEVVVDSTVSCTLTGALGVSDPASSIVVTTSICSGTSGDEDDGPASATAPKPAPIAVPAAAASFQLKRVAFMTTPCRVWIDVVRLTDS
jgi:hypothetical protein